MNREQLLEDIRKYAECINVALAEVVDTDDGDIRGLLDAERYSTMAGGKRIRPYLVYAFCRMHGGSDEAATPYAAAVEMIHTASLIHDDLPCIDNDELRRGRPTNHMVYGDAIALLAGDGLLMDAYGLVAGNEMVDVETAALAIKALSRATGSRGLVGGEYIDVMGESCELSLDTLLKMNAYKTGALIRVSVELGCLAAGVKPQDKAMADAVTYAEAIGLAFQIIDDILDVTGSPETLGKNPGQDAKDNKTTYLSFYSIEEAAEHAYALTEKAKAAVAGYEGSEPLLLLADYLAGREN